MKHTEVIAPILEAIIVSVSGLKQESLYEYFVRQDEKKWPL